MHFDTLFYINNMKKTAYVMATYSSAVSAAHKRYSAAVKRAGSGKAVMKAFSAHKKAHTRLLKKHLREELADAKRKGRKLARK